MSNNRYPTVTGTANGYCPAPITPNISPMVFTMRPGATAPEWETGFNLTYNATVTSNQTIDWTGARIVHVNLTLTGATNLTVTLNNLAHGTGVFWRVQNSSGAARAIP